MQAASVPTKFPIPWASGAASNYIRAIPEASQVNVQNGAASLTDGFPPNCFVAIPAGGSWPWGMDMNGILKQITQWNQWQQAGGPIYYDAAFALEIGGYPKGAQLTSASTVGLTWTSTVDGNGSNPDSTTSANWVAICDVPMTWSAPQVFNTNLFMNNNFLLYGKDTVGNYHGMIGYMSDNYVHQYGGTYGWVLNNSAGTQNNILVSDAGNMSLFGDLTMGYAIFLNNGANSAMIYTDGPGTPYGNDIVFRTGGPGAYHYTLIDYEGNIYGQGNFSTGGTISGANATAGNEAVMLGQLQNPLGGYQQLEGNATTLTASVTFYVGGPGLLIAWGSKNCSEAGAAAGDAETLYINGIAMEGDSTQVSASHMAMVYTGGYGNVSASYTAAYGEAFSCNVSLLFIPYAP